MTIRRFVPPAAIILLAYMLSGCGGGGGGTPQATGQVDGYVYLSEAQALTTKAVGTPAVGAEVRVLGQTASTLTDSTGYFTLSGVSIGPQTLVVSLAGYQSMQIPVSVVADVITRIPTESVTIIPASRKWTIMVFLNADNDLETFGIQDVNEMEQAPENEQVAVLVQFDRSPGYDTSNGNWSGCKRLLVRHDTNTATINSTVLEDMGAVDMGVPSALSNFIAWGMQLYPAEHYMVVVWDHGSGWRASSVVTGFTRGISYDYSTGNYLNTPELAVGLTAPAPLDIVSMDACLMQMLEIGYQIRNQCRYVVASEEDVPGEGYPYQTWLSDLAANPEMTPATFANTMASRTINYYSGSMSYLTHSVVDTAQLDEVAGALDSFAGAMIAVAGQYPAGFATARGAAESYADYDFKDLIHYANQVKANVGNAAVQTAANNLITAVQNAVVNNYAGPAHPNSRGLSIYVPTPQGYTASATNYNPLALSVNSRWNEWLAAQQQ
ncbi:MAG: clostripain-related cysteine peptidase [Armatimonadota bacterium]